MNSCLITKELGDNEVTNFNRIGIFVRLGPGSNTNSAFACCLYLEILLCLSEPQISYLQSGGNPDFHDGLL